MSTKFDWNAFSSSEEGIKETVPASSFDWSQYGESEKKPQPTRAQQSIEEGVEAVKGVGRLAGRGSAALVSAPFKGAGGLLQLLSLMGKEGRPGTKMIRAAGDYFQNLGEGGQAQMKEWVEDLLGKSYSTGEEAITKFAERAADIYGRGPVKGMGISAVVGGAAGQIAEELGASPETQQTAELLGMSAKDVGKGVKYLAKKPLISKSGLKLPRIVEKAGEKLRGLKARVWAGKKEKMMKQISSEAEELIGKIQKEEIPISKEIEKGIDVTARNQRNLDKLSSLSKKMTNKIESKHISDYLENIKNAIEFGGVPTTEQEGILKLIDKFKDKYAVTEAGTKFYTPSQYVQQFRNINKDLTSLYQTKFVHGERLDTMKFYEGLKGEFEKTLEAGTPKAFSNLFKETNKEFSQLKRLETFNEIMSMVTNESGILDPTKLNSYMVHGRKANILKKQIGKEGFDKLKLISNDLNKVKNKLKLVDEFGLKEVIKSGTTYGILSYLGVPFVKGAQIGKKGMEMARGYILMSPQGTRDVTNFLKAVQSGSKKSMRTYLLKMDENVKKYEKQKSNQQ